MSAKRIPWEQVKREAAEHAAGAGPHRDGAAAGPDDIVAQLGLERPLVVNTGIEAARYHGKLRMSERESTHERFMAGEIPVMVATNAFGLGIDKPDIRFVAHWNFPDWIECYDQEAGRAGRDGRPALAALLYRLEDKRVQSFFLGGKYPKTADEGMGIVAFDRARAGRDDGAEERPA